MESLAFSWGTNDDLLWNVFLQVKPKGGENKVLAVDLGAKVKEGKVIISQSTLNYLKPPEDDSEPEEFTVRVDMDGKTECCDLSKS